MSNFYVTGVFDCSSLGGGIKSLIVNLIYPVKSYFITESSAFDTVAKVKAHFGENTDWEQLDEGRFLESVTNSAVGINKAAGLPNITGTYGSSISGNNGVYNAMATSGVFSLTSGKADRAPLNVTGSGAAINFNASSSNSIYGNSSTVQPKSRTVYIYRRIL